MKKLNYIMLVDDNPDDNFFHERTIKKAGCARNVEIVDSGEKALEILKRKKELKEAFPDLLLLDINMPRMNGWEFMEEYGKLISHFDSKMVVIILTTSSNPDDEERAKTISLISGFKVKPLTKEMLEDILDNYFVTAE